MCIILLLDMQKRGIGKINLTAYPMTRPSRGIFLSKGGRLIIVNAHPFQLTLANLCQPTLANWVWARCIMARKRRVMDMVIRMKPGNLKVVSIFSHPRWSYSSRQSSSQQNSSQRYSSPHYSSLPNSSLLSSILHCSSLPNSSPHCSS